MAAKLSLSARNIVRYARENGITIAHFGLGSDNRHCARGVVGVMTLGPKFNSDGLENWYLYDSELVQASGLSKNQLDSLEAGFENDAGYVEDRSKIDKRYFKVGRNVAKLAGLV